MNGCKKWITNGLTADYFVTAVRTGGKGHGGLSFLLIERSEGVNTDPIKTDYATSAGTAYITFENVKVPAKNILGDVNGGFACIMKNFNHERLTIIAGVLGRTRRIVEECFLWANQREVFGKSLLQQTVIREKLGQMIVEVESAHALFERCTYQLCTMDYDEQGKKLGGLLGLTKYKATRAATLVADWAV